MKKQLLALAALSSVTLFAQAGPAPDEGFVAAVIPRIEIVTKQVRICHEARIPVQPTQTPGNGASAPSGAYTTAKSCEIYNKQGNVQTGWEVFVRYQNHTFSVKVVGKAPSVGSYVHVAYASDGSLVILEPSAQASSKS